MPSEGLCTAAACLWSLGTGVSTLKVAGLVLRGAFLDTAGLSRAATLPSSPYRCRTLVVSIEYVAVGDVAKTVLTPFI